MEFTTQMFGRKEIFTDVEEINKDNLLKVLRESYAIHTKNADRSNFLINYEAGYQPLTREKTYRQDIDCLCIDNVANEITEFKLSFNWGYPITLIQRGESDSGEENSEESKAISLLNECYEAEGIKKKTQELARYIEITGVGYTYVDVKTDDWVDGDSYFSVDVLDPRTTFIVKSSRYVDHRPMLGVTYRKDSLGNIFFTCFTADRRYEVENLVAVINGEEIKTITPSKWQEIDRSGEVNPLGIIPITEYIRAHDRMGCFERQLSELDNLNLLASDMTNDVEQNTQCIWWANNIKFPEDENGNIEHPQSNDWLETQSLRDGGQPSLKPLSVDYDYGGMINNYSMRRSLILQKCSVPQRNDNSGGSTGIAMSDATGWSSAEASACKQQGITESSKMYEVRVALQAIRKSTHIEQDNPLLKLRAIDIKPNIKRQKTYELSTKANVLATLLNAGVNGRHAFEVVTMFEDVQQAWEDSKAVVEKIQKSHYETGNEVNSERIMQDESDQEENSPMLTGKATINQRETSES